MRSLQLAAGAPRVHRLLIVVSLHPQRRRIHQTLLLHPTNHYGVMSLARVYYVQGKPRKTVVVPVCAAAAPSASGRRRTLRAHPASITHNNERHRPMLCPRPRSANALHGCWDLCIIFGIIAARASVLSVSNDRRLSLWLDSIQ